MTDHSELPPPSDERDTDPPDPAEEIEERGALATMLPEQREPAQQEPAHESRLSEAVRADSVNQLLKIYADHQQREEDLLSEHGKLAQINEDRANRIKRETVRELAEIVDKVAGAPIRDLKRMFAELANTVGQHSEQIRVLRESQVEQGEQGEDLKRALAVVESQLRDVMVHVDELRQKIDKRARSSPGSNF